jgi:hypothetical protein
MERNTHRQKETDLQQMQREAETHMARRAEQEDMELERVVEE